MICPKRIAVIILLGCLVGGGLYTYRESFDRSDNVGGRPVFVSLSNTGRSAGIAAHFPAEATPVRVTGRPPIDLAIPVRTETALFALG